MDVEQILDLVIINLVLEKVLHQNWAGQNYNNFIKKVLYQGHCIRIFRDLVFNVRAFYLFI